MIFYEIEPKHALKLAFVFEDHRAPMPIGIQKSCSIVVPNIVIVYRACRNSRRFTTAHVGERLLIDHRIIETNILSMQSVAKEASEKKK